MKLRTRALVCLLSFVAGLLGTGVAPVMAATSSLSPVDVSPEYRAANQTEWTNPYYRAMNTPYYNPNLVSGQTGALYGNAYTQGMPYLANQNGGATPTYYDPSLDARTNPNLDQRYNNTYGSRYDSSYYGGTTGTYSSGYQLPGIVGAVAGLAIGCRFGAIGAVVGGIGGWLIGNTVGTKILNAAGVSPYGNLTQSWVPMISGIAGGLLGAFMVSGMGPLAMLVAGSVGFAIARMAVRWLAPNLYYYGLQRPLTGSYATGAYGTGVVGTGVYRNSIGTAGANTVGQYTYAPGTTAPDLSGAQAAYTKAMKSYKDALASGNGEAQKKARATYVTAEKAFRDAQKAAAGTAVK